MVLRKREKCVKIKNNFQNKKLININLGFHKLTPDVKPQNVSSKLKRRTAYYSRLEKQLNENDTERIKIRRKYKTNTKR